MSSVPNLINKTMKYGDWLYDRDLEAADSEALAAYDRRLEIERSVTFEELIEHCATFFTDVQGNEFMRAVERGENRDLHLMHALLLQMKEGIVKDRLAEPDKPRFSVTYCSQCGKALGAGNNGVSHCYKHGGV